MRSSSDTISIGKYLIETLKSPEKVKHETYLMQDSIWDYVQECTCEDYQLYGNIQLFLVRNHLRKSIAIFGAIKKDGYWYFDNFFSENNSEVMEETHLYRDKRGQPVCLINYTEIYSAVHEVIRLLNQHE